MAKIKTTGDLREFLASTINSVANGTIDPQKASSINKLASQINESFYSEIKIARVRNDLKKPVADLGSLPLNSGETSDGGAQ